MACVLEDLPKRAAAQEIARTNKNRKRAPRKCHAAFSASALYELGVARDDINIREEVVHSHCLIRPQLVARGNWYQPKRAVAASDW
mmetsp:Transcript_19972/g.45900  ORF Transcript_19972/g.45900 Transcript_19972/m.45900 type:complete len:86 (+) Transcript_19972:251-508(+)